MMNELSHAADARLTSIGEYLSSDPRNRRSAGFQPFPDLRCASVAPLAEVQSCLRGLWVDTSSPGLASVSR